MAAPLGALQFKTNKTRGIAKRNRGQTYGPFVAVQAAPWLDPGQQRVSLVEGSYYKFSGLGITPPQPPPTTRMSWTAHHTGLGGHLMSDVIEGTFRGIETINGISSYLVEPPGFQAMVYRLLTSLVTKIVYIRG